MKINLSTLNPIIDLRENLVLANNGNLILGYKMALPEIYSLSEKDYEELHSVWFQGLRTLLTGCVVHKQEVYLKKNYSSDKLPKRTFLEKATYSHFKGRSYIEHESYLFFIWPRNKTLNNTRYVNPFKKITSAEIDQMESDLADFSRSVEDTVSFLNTSRKFKIYPIDEDQIDKICASYFNGYSEGFDTDILLEGNHLQVGQNLFDILAINSELCFGETVQTSKVNENYTSDEFLFHQGFVDRMGLELEENHIVNQIVFLDDKHRWRKILEKRIEELKKSSNFGSQNRIILQKLKQILHQINQDENSRVVRGHFNVTFWHPQARKLSQMASKVKTAFKDLDVRPYYPLGEARKNYFLNSFFCYSSNFSDEDLYVADLKHAVCLLINNTNYRSDPQGIIFNDRQFNVPVLKDVWDNQKRRIKARNFAIFAPTGEGKSFLANNILRQYFEAGVRLVIIDLGGSYSKFAKLYPEDHLILRYEQGKSLGLNPFFITHPEAINPQHIEELSHFLVELFGAEGTITKAQEVAIKKILRSYYRYEEKEYSMKSFYTYVKAKRASLLQDLQIHRSCMDVEKFLHILSEYIDEGLYGFLFEVQEDQSFRLEDKRLIVFELDEIRDNKEVLAVMLKLIKSAIQRTIWQNRKERGIILFDEFAKQLKFKNVLESVEYYYQAIRKQSGAIGIILQSINQLPDNSTSASILENTQVIYSLFNEKGYKPLQKRLNLSAHDLNQLNSIRNNLSGSRKYTEIFIKIGRESNVFRLEVPPEVYAAYLTDGKENEEILELCAQTGSMEEAISIYITKTKNI